MKLSKYIYFASILAAGSLALTSCSDDGPGGGDGNNGNNGNNTPSENALKISTTVLTEATVTTDLTDGATMNIFVKTGGSLSSNDFVTGVKASNQSGSWVLSPAVEFIGTQRTLFVYAAAPFDASGSFDPTHFPVDCTKQLDVLYSGRAAAANIDQGITTAKLTMKHALAMVSFNIMSSNYTGAGKLTSLSLNGQNVFSEGHLNVETGEVTGTAKKAFTVEFDKTISATGWKEGIPSMWTIPTSTKGSDAVLSVVIDGKTYDVTLPQIDIRGGFQTLFHLILTPNGLVFRPDQTQTISLNVGTDDPQLAQFYGVLKFTVKSGDFKFPTFTGDNVFGNIVSGTTMLNYSIGGKINLTGATNDVVVETWNSTGFELNDIVGVDEIDLSAY